MGLPGHCAPINAQLGNLFAHRPDFNPPFAGWLAVRGTPPYGKTMALRNTSADRRTRPTFTPHRLSLRASHRANRFERAAAFGLVNRSQDDDIRAHSGRTAYAKTRPAGGILGSRRSCGASRSYAMAAASLDIDRDLCDRPTSRAPLRLATSQPLDGGNDAFDAERSHRSSGELRRYRQERTFIVS